MGHSCLHIIIETERLALRTVSTDDAAFILALLNDPGWLRFIGDKGVRNLDDARAYIKNGPQAMYESVGHGLWLTELKGQGTPIGLCGLIKRDGLDEVDIGFAFLPEFRAHGYALEAATAVLRHGHRVLGLRRIVAITDLDNQRSAHLLEQLGMRMEGTVTLPTIDHELKLYSLDF